MQINQVNGPDRSAWCFRFGTAEFDEARFELRVAGLPVDVERRALEVLAYLLRHAGEVVTKDELLREVWAGRITVDKVLPNAINKLRRALGESNAGHVCTLARLGYRLDGTVSRIAVGRQPASSLDFKAGQPVPGRGNFVLMRQLGHTMGNEVWLAEQARTRQQRVYKFALDGERLRALKREATLLRVLQESLPDDTHRFVEIVDWNFEQAPFFLESEYGGLPLTEWAAAALPELDLEARVALFLQIADAVAAAHSVGVLHKDLKPANVLVTGAAAAPQVRLTDFGSGQLLDPDRLTQLGITRLGMTVDGSPGTDSHSGTPIYLAPELFAGQTPTVRSDVYALGILLYQLLTARIGQPMASGWEDAVADVLLREDIALATSGNPDLRLSSAAELSQRLRQLALRHSERLTRDRAAAQAQRDQKALARAQARRPIVTLLILVMAVAIVVSLWLQQDAVRARNAARLELERAGALARFLNEDLIGQANPLVSAKGADATLREALLSARDRIGTRFGAQPQTEAAVRSSLASLFNTIDLFAEAEAEARRALELEQALAGPDSADVLRAKSILIRVLSRRGAFPEAQRLLAEIEQVAGSTPSLQLQQQLAATQATLQIGRGEFDKASQSLQQAIAGLDPADATLAAQRDALRLDLIRTLTAAGQDAVARAEGDALIREFAQRGDSPELLLALTRLALVRAQGEDHAAAEQLLLQARPVIAGALGENHIRYLQLLGELQGVAFRRGDWPRAIDYAQQLHERVRSKLGEGHVLTYVTLVNWARTLSESGAAAPAREKAASALKRLRELVGIDAPQAQDAAVVLALAELQLRHTAAAETLIAQLDPVVLESGRATGLWPAAIQALQGIALQQRGEAAAARPLLDAALVALQPEEDLDAPSQLFQTASKARQQLDAPPAGQVRQVAGADK